jgi:hypothetical protein
MISNKWSICTQEPKYHVPFSQSRKDRYETQRKHKGTKKRREKKVNKKRVNYDSGTSIADFMQSYQEPNF